MKRVNIHIVAAARPNFMKIAPLYHALVKEEWAKATIVHTGQHYDLNMSEAFFRDLGLPEPDINLGIGSGTHAEQTGEVMMAYEKILLAERPVLVIVVGDVNSTMAATLASIKLGIKVAHLEAGLRSFDRTMPEEINRVVTDAVADILWTPSPDADENLIREGVPKDKIIRVGNIMIDSLVMMRAEIEKAAACDEFGLPSGSYGLVTLHRPSNVDSPVVLESISRAIGRISQKMPLVFPIHPRTRKNLEQNGSINYLEMRKNLMLLQPLNYVRFMNLVFNCRFVITDSGGIQEETTYLGIPCLTLRANTERPITVKEGTNRLIKPEQLEETVEAVISGGVVQKRIPELWDGQTASRVLKSISKILMRRDGK